MQERTFRRWYLLYAAQLFLVLLLVLTPDLLVRWGSITRGMKGIEPWNMIAIGVIPLALVAALAALPIVGTLVLVASWRGHLARVCFQIIQLATLLLLPLPHYATLRLWVAGVLDFSALDARGQLFSVIAFVILAIVFRAFHRRFTRVGSDVQDTAQLIGGLLFTFSSFMVGFLLIYAVVGSGSFIGAQFRRFGAVFMLAYGIVYWRPILALLDRMRLFVGLAIVVLGVSAASVSLSFLVTTPQRDIPLPLAPGGASSPLPDVENIILVTFDGLAADAMSLYGNPHVTTPNLDALGKMSNVFDRTHAEADATEQSLPAIQTGMHTMGGSVH